MCVCVCVFVCVCVCVCVFIFLLYISASYMSPEVLDRSFNKACDMWSFGVIVFICLFGYAPFLGLWCIHFFILHFVFKLVFYIICLWIWNIFRFRDVFLCLSWFDWLPNDAVSLFGVFRVGWQTMVPSWSVSPSRSERVLSPSIAPAAAGGFPATATATCPNRPKTSSGVYSVPTWLNG